jgi:hypothetical protein
MYNPRPRIIQLVVPAILLFAWILIPIATHAATIDEIVAMSDAGLTPEVIIDVIDATGLEEPMDVDTWIGLQKQGVHEDVLSYLIQFLPEGSETGSDTSGSEGDPGDSNRLGGEGFHHGGSDNYSNDYGNSGNDYWEGPSYRNDYYPPLGSIGVWVPPVYVMGRHPYRAYPAPRYYDYNRGYWDNGRYVIYDRNYNYPYYDMPYDYWQYGGYGHDQYWYDNPDDWYWRWKYDRHGSGWNGSIEYNGDDFGISLHF